MRTRAVVVCVVVAGCSTPTMVYVSDGGGDLGASDVGTTDAGSGVDAGVADASDVGSIDAGEPASDVVDAGVADASEAGVDAVDDTAVGAVDASEAGVDGGCATGMAACGSACVDTQTDVNHCGVCNNRCPVGAAGTTPACVAGECILRCLAGQRWTGRDCVTITTPRPVGPLTPFVVSTLRPTLRWDFGTGNDGARVEICSNRDCTGAPVQTFDATGSSGRVPMPLMARRPYWWRLYGRAGDATGTTPSVTWMFQTPARDLGTDTTLTPTRRDINGDGYDDIVIGSFINHVEVLFGSASGLRTGMSERLVFENTEAGFGYSNALGDVNGDGLADLVAASRSNVYVYHGSVTAPFLPSSPSTTINVVASAGATKSVETLVGVGDANSDGYDDIVAGEWNTRVIVASGTGAGIDPASVIALTPRLSGSSLTWAYFVPDLDGNGFSEMVISNLCHPTSCGTGSTGQAWLFAGTRTGLATATATPSGIGMGLPATNANFGYGVDGNDWDGDGYGDIIVGSGGIGATLYRGRTALPPVRSSALVGLSRQAMVSGDFDLDGTPELAASIGASSAPDAVEIYRGGVGTPRSIMGTDGGDFGGWLSIGDYNGNGVLDLAVGAVNAFARRGRVYVFPGARGTGVASMASHVIDPIGAGIVSFGHIR